MAVLSGARPRKRARDHGTTHGPTGDRGPHGLRGDRRPLPSVPHPGPARPRAEVVRDAVHVPRHGVALVEPREPRGGRVRRGVDRDHDVRARASPMDRPPPRVRADQGSGRRRARRRPSRRPPRYVRGLLESEGFVAVVADEGYPQPTIAREEFEAALGGVTVHRVGRIEPWIVEAREEGTFDGLVQRFEATANEAADDPLLIGFKSIIAYRTGLDVTDPSSSDAAAAFDRWRADGWRRVARACEGGARLPAAAGVRDREGPRPRVPSARGRRRSRREPHRTRSRRTRSRSSWSTRTSRC